MKHILIFGTGRSSSHLIDYLHSHSTEFGWQITLADQDESHLKAKTAGKSNLHYRVFNSSDQLILNELVAENDVVISMLPAFLHPVVAEACIQHKKHLFTASYVSDFLKSKADIIEQNNLLFMNECGLDPGIDHMSAMRVLDHLKTSGAEITGFESYCGGLVAPACDNNAWNYKFSWNPRNVVLAGQGVSKFLQHGTHKYIPYHKLFERTDTFQIPGYGAFEAYANRDSLSYISVYGLESIQTMYRGTLRRAGYSKAWNVFVQLGMTDDSYQLEVVDNLTHVDFLKTFLPESTEETLTVLKNYLPSLIDEDVVNKLNSIDLFSSENIGVKGKMSPAAVLQFILERKWAMAEGDRDLVAMLHFFDYKQNGATKRMRSYMMLEGENDVYTAMSKTVGLPLAIAVKLFMTGKVADNGVVVPVASKWYNPILDELEANGIKFIEEEI